MKGSSYHVGFGIRGRTFVIEARRSVDYLSCEIYDYMGERETTKARLREGRYALLRAMQTQRPNVYGGLKYAIVD
jgi:hypothetical protein